MSTFTSADSLADATGLSGNAPADLLPRYRRPLTFGAVLDETFRIFRRAWRPLMIALALGAVPYGLVVALASGWITSSTFNMIDASSGAAAADDFGPFVDAFGGFYAGAIGLSILGFLFLLPAYAAVVVISDGEMRGRPIPVMDAFKRGLRATPTLLLAALLGSILLLLLTLAAIPLFALGLFGVLGGLVALIGVLVWWGNPRARKNWLRWLIILATPFGLLWYFTYRWAVALPAIVLEREDASGALRRSMELTRGHWFRIFGVLTVLGIVSAILQAIPTGLATLLGGAAGFAVGTGGSGGVAEAQQLLTFTNVLSAAAQSLGMVLFGALPFIAMTLLFQDLRNRHEGADLAERLAAVESMSASVA